MLLRYLHTLVALASLLLAIPGNAPQGGLLAQEVPFNIGPGGICVRIDRTQLAGLPLPEALMIIIDRSGSMGDPSGTGMSRMQLAQQVLREYLNDLPDDAVLGIRAYGYGQSCSGTRLLYAIDRIDRNQLQQIVSSLSPDGDTPIAYTLEQLPGDLDGVRGKKEILLVTDGQETCGGNPIAIAERLAASDPDLAINVIGFEINDIDAQLNLRGIPRVARGIYISAESQYDLLQALSVAVRVPFYVYDESQNFLGEGLSNRTTFRADTEGIYLVEIPDLGIKRRQVPAERGRGSTLSVDANGDVSVIRNDALCIAEFCPNVPLPRLVIVSRARVTFEDARRPLRVRDLPGLNGVILTRMNAGQMVDVLDGPICNDSYLWWLVNNGAVEGWSAEGTNEFYYLEPIP